MKYIFILLSSVILLSCNKEEPVPQTVNQGTTPQNQYAGIIEFDVQRGNSIEHISWNIVEVTEGTIGVFDAQGNMTIESYTESSNRKNIGFRYLDENEELGYFHISASTVGSTNSITLQRYGNDPVYIHTNTSVPLCNTTSFQITVTSPNEATFEANYLEDQHNGDVVDVLNGRYELY